MRIHGLPDRRSVQRYLFNLGDEAYTLVELSPRENRLLIEPDTAEISMEGSVLLDLPQ